MTRDTLARRLLGDERGATAIEFAFAFPALIVMIYCIAQLGLVYRAASGMQHALGEGARMATIFPAPTDQQLEDKLEESVYGIGPGTFTYAVTPVDDPATTTIDESQAGWRDLEVRYTQPTSLLLFPGPTITIVRNKRAWIAS